MFQNVVCERKPERKDKEKEQEKLLVKGWLCVRYRFRIHGLERIYRSSLKNNVGPWQKIRRGDVIGAQRQKGLIHA
jgi:hypothetical protein